MENFYISFNALKERYIFIVNILLFRIMNSLHRLRIHAISLVGSLENILNTCFGFHITKEWNS